MHAVVQDNMKALRDLAIKHRVERLDLFGSATREDFDAETSDLDFLVSFELMPPWSTPTAFSACSRISSACSGGASNHL